MNENQEALFQWIAAGLAIHGVRSLRGDAGYLFNNMIAKYSLSADKYLLSEGAFAMLVKNSVDLSRVHTRSKFYGKKSLFMYEHAIPARIVRTRLLQGNLDPDSV